MEMHIRFQNNTTVKMKALMLILMMSCFFTGFAQSPDEQYMAGCAYLYKGDYIKAAESFSLAISRNNSDEKLYILRGSALLNGDDTEKAIEDFTEANLVRPNVADLWLARAYATGGDPSNAIVFLERHLNSTYKISEDSIKKDPAFDRLQDTPEWHALWQKEWYDDVEKSLADAAFYSNKKQYDEAISLLDEEISRNPSEPSLIMMRGKVFMEQGNFGAAVGDFSSAMNADKTLTSGYALRGSAYLKAGRLRKQLMILPGLYEMIPENLNCINNGLRHMQVRRILILPLKIWYYT
jgi:tetratricopeptide (TPR) repeat protein